MQRKHNSDDEKRRAHELIDRPQPKEDAAVVGLLESLLDPLSRAVAAAPIDDEPLSAEGQAALEQSRDCLKHNKSIPHEQFLAELAITPEQIQRFMKSM